MTSQSATTEPASGVSSAPRTFIATDAPAAILALLVEAGVVAAVAVTPAILPLGLLAHAGVVLLLLLRAWQRSRRGRDAAATLLLALMIAIAGPFAALGGLLLGWISRHGPADDERLEAWYDRISFSTKVSDTTRLSERIMTGRIADHADAMPPSFLTVLATGSIREQQVILGLIARRFHPDYLPALQAALVSDAPVIRVQAAAVAAKVRGDIAHNIDGLLSVAADPTTAAADVVRCLGEAERCVASGLMEAPDRLRATAVIDGLLAAAADRFDRNPGTRHHTTVAPLLDHYEAHLLAQRRYGDFRRLRRDRAWRARGAARFRPLRRSASGSGLRREAAQ